MPARKWTDDQREQALTLYREHGPAEAERRTGIPKRTIASWARRAGVQTDAPRRTAAAVRAAEMKWAERRAGLADTAGQVAATLAMRVFDTADAKDAKALVDAMREAAGVAQLLSGGATARTEHEVTDPDARLAIVRDLQSAAAQRQAGAAS